MVPRVQDCRGGTSSVVPFAGWSLLSITILIEISILFVSDIIAVEQRDPVSTIGEYICHVSSIGTFASSNTET